jgi:5-methylcytosine-specific restriction endonuclease McrA
MLKKGELVRAKRKQYHYDTYTDDGVRKKAQKRTREWALKNPEWAKRNSKVAKHKRRALEKQITGSFSADDIKDIFKAQGRRCAYCRKKLGLNYHADHIQAIVNGGTNDRSNIQLTCDKCNLYKSAKDPIDFARSIGKLL